MSSRADVLACFEQAARDAGARILALYDDAQLVRTKEDASPLTLADLAAHETILAALRREMPDVPIVSEEDGDAERAAPGPRFILVDPLDGTKEFLSRNGEFTVNIALVEEGAPRAGVVYAPAKKVLWTGGRGLGAERVDLETGERRPLTVRSLASSPRPVVAVASRSHRDPATDAFLQALGVEHVRSVGSSLKFCLVAEGEADVYPRFAPTMEWDVAAGQAVLEGAGGLVTGPHREPFVYGKAGASFRNGSFVAWGDPALVDRAPLG